MICTTINRGGIVVSTLYCTDRESLQDALTRLQPGDCIQIPGFAEAASDLRELLSAVHHISACGADFVSQKEGVDTRLAQGADFFAVCRALGELDRHAKDPTARSARYKGRVPIHVDDTLFESVVTLWKSGQITARQAMAKLNLKPNTFYRRIKERELRSIPDSQELRSEIREATRHARQSLDEIRQRVRTDAGAVKKAAGDTRQMLDAEAERHVERIRAEAEHHEALRQMKKDVENETKELKKLIAEQPSD